MWETKKKDRGYKKASKGILDSQGYNQDLHGCLSVEDTNDSHGKLLQSKREQLSIVTQLLA